jgi:hypothetical protein
MALSGNQFVNSFGSVIALKITSGEASMTMLFFISIVSFCCPFPCVVDIKGIMIKSGVYTFKYFLNYKDIMGSPWKALSRGISNRFAAEMKAHEAELALYPAQSWALAPLLAAAVVQGRTDMMLLCAGQSASLLTSASA